MMSNTQINLFDSLSNNQSISYSDVQKAINEFLADRADSEQNTQFKMNRGNLAISFFDYGGSSRSIWVKLGKKTSRLEIKPSYCLLVDSLMDCKDSLKKLSNGHYSLPFADIQELTAYKHVILDIYDYCERKTKGKLFDCCHRYLDCSNARDCVHPDKEFALSCSYRRKVKQGIIFYGKNRNV